MHDIALYCMVLHGNTMMVLNCTIVGFGARAVSRKTPIYFILQNFLYIEDTFDIGFTSPLLSEKVLTQRHMDRQAQYSSDKLQFDFCMLCLLANNVGLIYSMKTT